MFRTRSRSERAAEEAQAAAMKAQAASLKAQAAALKEKVSPAALQARENALAATGAARGWAAPRYERARVRGMKRAAPRVELAAETLAPKVDAARDRIVDELLPRIVDAVAAAAAVAAAKTEEAREASHHGLSSVSSHMRSVVEPEKPKHRKRKALLVLSVVGAAAGAGWTAWKRSQPADDPWVSATNASPNGTSGSRLSGGTSSGGLGAGTLATDSGDVETPVPDGLASGTESGEAVSDKTGADASSPSEVVGDAEVGGTGVSGTDTPTPADVAKGSNDKGTGKHSG